MIGVNGPYERGRLWRLVVVDADGARHTHAYDTEAEAIAAKAAYEQELAADRWLPGVVDALIASTRPLPAAPRWIYLLHDQVGTVVYVGQSGSLTERIGCHRDRGIEFASASYLAQEFSIEHASHVERALVRHLRPKFNVDLSGGKRSEFPFSVEPNGKSRTA